MSSTTGSSYSSKNNNSSSRKVVVTMVIAVVAVKAGAAITVAVEEIVWNLVDFIALVGFEPQIVPSTFHANVKTIRQIPRLP